ncbi:transcription antiterminator BglG [Vagococcus penaei]|uniref:Transcription antiterminator BglG n=1 Tax=Vagococcus penaei TaxID=633807 RepID=A0A1Q2D4S9_9ENTE|nr:PRD domain-containing protein [Vagococcus penaei]AQP53383.1 transcription antiterminator BglG [Vagococcus penaei]RST99705.1 transcription antiterminator BglG [Vagococcus penaei]
MYIINKVLNNNVVISYNEKNEEIIIMGKGLAFGKKTNDEVDPIKIEKIFSNHQAVNFLDMERLFQDVDERIIDISKEIVLIAERDLAHQYSDKTYLTLIDHINYAVKRYAEGITIPNPLLLEIKKFYPGEYQVALKGLKLLKNQLDINFSNDEAGFIALHLVTNNLGQKTVQETIKATGMVRDILAIIRRYFGIDFNESSLNYTRMVTHIQYFVQRILMETTFKEQDDFLYELIQSKYPKAFQCSLRVKDYLEKKHAIKVDDSELIYLVIHINRVVDEFDKK